MRKFHCIEIIAPALPSAKVCLGAAVERFLCGFIVGTYFVDVLAGFEFEASLVHGNKHIVRAKVKLKLIANKIDSILGIAMFAICGVEVVTGFACLVKDGLGFGRHILVIIVVICCVVIVMVRTTTVMIVVIVIIIIGISIIPSGNFFIHCFELVFWFGFGFEF